MTPARNLRRPAAAIIAALSVESCRLGTNVGISRASPCSFSSARSRLLADTPPATPMLLRLIAARRRRTARSIERGHDDALEAGADVGDLRRSDSGRLARADVAQHRGLQAAEAEIEIALELAARCGRRASGASSAARSRGRCRSRASRSIDRAARIAETEQLRHLVVRLAGRIVSRPAEQLVATRDARPDTGWCARPRPRARPPAAAARRSAAPATRCGRPGDARRRAAGRRPRPPPSRTTRRPAASRRGPGPCVTAIAPRSRPATRRLVERALDDAADVANVLARGELRHDAAPLAVNRHLRGDDVRADRPRPRAIAGLLDDGGGRSRRRRFRCRGSASASPTRATALLERALQRLGVRRRGRCRAR